jgi:hypothetical protein
MGIKTKTGLGKLTGTATVIRKDGTREEVKVTAKVSKEQIAKLVADDKLRELDKQK